MLPQKVYRDTDKQILPKYSRIIRKKKVADARIMKDTIDKT